MSIDAQWRPVVGWEGIYEVSSDGRVRSLYRERARHRQGITDIYRRQGRQLKIVLRNGYPCVPLRDQGRHELAYVHRLVCMAFHGPAPDGREVAHIDGSRTNNRPENLRWATRLENVHDKQRHGTQRCGEDIPVSKLKETEVREILASSLSQAELGRRYGVNQGTIHNIKARKNWRHVDRRAA